MAEGALLHSCAVYLYLYDDASGSYAQRTDAAVGCALLAGERAAQSGSDAFSLLLYDTQKTPLLQLPVTPSARFVPQKDNYINFYERQTQRNFAMRFKDAGTSEAFMSAVSYAKAQVLVHSSKSYDRNKPAVLVDQLAVGKEDAAPLNLGDVAGVTLKKWQGTVEQRESFFSANPLEIKQQPTAGASGEVKRIKLQEGASEMDPFTRILATEALVGMQKMGKRLVTVTFPETNEWVIAEMELVKVKKNTRSSAATTDQSVESDAQEQEHDELVKRMASLSRMGSQSSGLIASVKTRLDSRSSMEPNGEIDTSLTRASSLGQQSGDPPAGYVPVLLAGLQLPGERPGSLRNLHNEMQTQVQTEAASPPHAMSLAAKVFEPLKHSAESIHVDTAGGTKLASLSSDMERLMKEQSDLARLREQLEESKRKLQSEDTSSSDPSGASNGASDHSSSLTEYKPAQDKPAPFTPSSFALLGSSAPSIATSSSYGHSTSRWTPPKLDMVPSFSPSAFVPPSQPPPAIPPAPSAFSSSLTPYTNRSFPSYSSTPSSGSSPDVENGIIRLQRSSTSIESTLHDLQSKMDRLLNSQNSMKSTKFVASSSKYSGNASFSASSSSSSSSMLLKNLEKALAQRDQLQETNARLEEANGELESSVEELQSQHESLQMENRSLLDKLQNGNHLQQEKFRLELRSVQQQLSHTQEQMLVYQEENFQLRAQLAAKDEQLAKEKTKLQEDTHQQLQQLQRQVEDEVRQGSKDSIERMATEKAALEAQVAELMAQKNQWDVEREMMSNRLSQAQSQQVQLQDESIKSQAAQNSRVQELMTRVQQLEAESKALKQQAEGFHSEAQHLEELLASKEHEMTQLQSTRNDQEYAALSELFKEFMNDIYFHFQDAFDEDTEFTGKEIVMAIRKILKQNTMGILAKLEEFYHQQALQKKRLDKDSLSAFIKKDRRLETPASTDTSPPTGPFGAVDASQLLRKIGRKSKKIKLLSEQVDSFKAKAQDAMQKAQHLEMEQEQFFDDVQEMKTQFDKLAESHRKLMWEYLPARDPSLRAVPCLTAQLLETPTTVGKYPLEQVLGYGQYAVVYTSSTPEHPELAVKAIDKQKLMDLVSLHRISSEITSLSDAAIRHPGFFAPELLLHDGYDGCKADVWSIGCILLELVLGNTLFSSIWMSMYEISILKEPKKFAEH
ncbi:hypothetical protein JG688_00010602 [Phytophthora aleatoria]|uniref:Protein kinase domain-containing protein n=1 Tax=Phytophthora aleatoria TaxID=2496075 RepID=A0A8J5IEG3_9STRA|nr:hypothetical protein JG688_00010602 [Phytophthora aleatoria]